MPDKNIDMTNHQCHTKVSMTELFKVMKNSAAPI